MIRIQCPCCAKDGQVSDDARGKKIRCKACRQIFQVPEATERARSELDHRPPSPREQGAEGRLIRRLNIPILVGTTLVFVVVSYMTWAWLSRPVEIVIEGQNMELRTRRGTAIEVPRKADVTYYRNVDEDGSLINVIEILQFEDGNRLAITRVKGERRNRFGDPVMSVKEAEWNGHSLKVVEQ